MFDFITPWLQNPYALAAILVAGFVFLILGADWLVDGASGIAKRYQVSDLVIGLTIVAFGTSMPEMIVNLVSVVHGTTDIAITNILGSNTINVFIILGLTAIVYPVASQKSSRKFDIPFAMAAGLLVLIFVAADNLFGNGTAGIGRGEGIVLLIFFVIFMVLTFRRAKVAPSTIQAGNYRPMKTWKALVLIVFGLLLLVCGGEMIVKSSVKIATDLGISDAIIGLTVVALGTSLPELATSVVAAFKKNSDLALGNVIGSNIFNVFFVLGISSVIHPLPAYDGLAVDAFLAALGCALVWIFVETNKEREVKRWEGLLLVLIYAGYLTYRLMTM